MVTEQDSEGPSFGKEARAVADTDPIAERVSRSSDGLEGYHQVVLAFDVKCFPEATVTEKIAFMNDATDVLYDENQIQRIERRIFCSCRKGMHGGSSRNNCSNTASGPSRIHLELVTCPWKI